MTGKGRRPIRRGVVIGAMTTVAVAALSAVLATRAPADAHTSLRSAGSYAESATTTVTKITVTSGVCRDGGTEFCFKPEVVTIPNGSQVMWTNESGGFANHTATSCTSSACPGAPANTGSNTFSVSIGASNGSSASFTFTGAGKYFYYCMVHGYTAMHGEIVVVAPPAVRSFTPTSGPVGTTVKIHGSNLAHASKVTFNGTSAVVLTDTAGTITAKVPTGATTGPISVTTAGGTVRTSTNFTVT